MKYNYFLVLLVLLSFNTNAQRTKDAALEDSIFAWLPMAPLKPGSYPYTVSAANQKLPTLFFDWIKKTHFLVGAVSKPFAVAEPNKKDEPMPAGVGVFAATYKAMWDNVGKAVTRTPHTELAIQIMSNVIYGQQILTSLSTPNKPVFTLRSSAENEAFKNDALRTGLIKEYNLSNHPQINKYKYWYFGCDGTGCLPNVVVYLAPGNKLPIRQLSRGEVLNLIETAIPAEAEKARKKIIAENSYRKDAQAKWLKQFENETRPKWKVNVDKLKKQYAQSLNQPAETKNVNGIAMINIFNGDDIFENSNTTMYGIYTYEDGVMEKSKGDKPLWIAITWVPAPKTSAVYHREQHKSMMQHFNFDYAYNYFFDPEKVKGQSYTILNEEARNATKNRVTNAKPTAIKTNTSKAGAFLEDDFSANEPGDKPKGWFQRSGGNQNIIVQPNGLPGNWVQLENQQLMPFNLPAPLPQDFKMEFDVACENFTGGTGAELYLNIANKELTPNGDFRNAANPVNIRLRIRPGNSKLTGNPAGTISLKTEYKGMPNDVRYANNPMKIANHEFSNTQTKACISIVKKGNQVTGFINGRPLETVAKDKYGNIIPGFNQLPDGVRFTTFSFEKSDGADRKAFLGNVIVTKL